MRKNLKRAISLLLAVVMVLGVLPVMAYAADTYVATAATGIPEGKDVVIYNAAANSVTSSTVDNFIAPLTANLSDGKLEVKAGTGAYRFAKNEDGTYFITLGGKYLYAKDSSNMGLSESVIKGAKWQIKATTDGYHIYNAEVQYNGRDVYIEYYGSFKLWSYSSSTEPTAYIMSFYELPAEADDDGDGRVGGAPAPAGSLPADGSKVVIYNDAAAGCFGAQDGSSLQNIASTVEGESIEAGNGALIFDVHVDGDYYTFENNGQFLRTSDNKDDGGNDEELFFDAAESDYTKWKLKEVEGGYLMENKVATYNSRPVVIEYFGESFSGWTVGSSADMSIFAMKFYAVEDEMGLGYILNPKMNIVAQNAHYGIPYEFKVKLDELSEVKSINVTASVDGGAAFALTAKSVDGYEYVYGIDGEKLNGSKLTLKGSAKNEYGMTYSAEVTVDISDEPIILSVSPAVNEATKENKRPEIAVNIANCGENPTVSMKVDDVEVTPTVSASKISYKPAENMADGRHAVYVSITREDGKSTEMTWSFFVGEAGLGLYFGQMHSHTAEYSDGAGTLEDAYTYASKADDIDFMFVTDHSNYFDTTATATTSSYYDLSSLTKSGDITKWEEARATAAEYTTDSFIAAYGYEMTWSGGPGHTNSFNTYGLLSRNNSVLNNKTGYAGMHLYNDLMVNANLGLDVNGAPVAEGVKTKYIEDAPVVSQFNHPGTTFGNFDNFAGYTPARDSVLSLVEVGNGEGAVGGNAYFPSYSEYDLALSKGWHVAPTNNQDNHKGKWGDANTARDVVVTEDFTEAGLYKAMSERRVYATEDQNLRIYYYLNDALMGSVISIEDGETIEKVLATASISDPDGEGLGKIEVIGENGLSVYSVDVAGSTYELKAELPNTDAYYYLKITQADGDIAVTAPVWVGEATPISATIDNSVAISVVGESETITTTVTNSAEADYVISKIEFSLIAGGEESIIHTITEAKTVAAGSSETFSFDYVRTVEGAQTIKVIYYGTYRGKEFKCQATMEQKAFDASDVVRVGVDYGHDNYYLSGNYKDTAGNFIQFCAENGVLCEYIQRGEFTYENISQYGLLVLTVPYLRKDGKAYTYTEDEIAALARFAQEGGSLIICSKSDRENQYDNCADNSNALLEAIGAHTRVVNGIIVDNEMKANEAYRVYFSSIDNFNTEHPFTSGTYTACNAFGTVPSPENQTGFQVYNGAPIEIQEGYEDKVEVLIRGYETTWGSHYDGYFTGAAFVPEYDEADPNKVTVKQGDVNVMTYEDLPAGGWVLTSGVTFFSDYDIKEEVEYANKYILRNILRELTGDEEVVTPIATVKKQSEGEFTVDGYVTSNASAYDQDTAFFDCIYVQDKEGNGLNIFPVAGFFAIGMNVRCHGGITFYCGEVELNLSTDYNGSIRIISDEIYVVEPTRVTCKEAMSDATIGNLMMVGGEVTSIHKTEGVIDKIYVKDATGEACVFINGYINKDYTGLDTLTVGDLITAVGIGSRDVDETAADGAVFARLRVRNRSEIVIVEDNDGPSEDPKPVELPFTDVPENAWYYEAVSYAYSKGMINGMTPTTFAPDGTLTRSMVATILYRSAGEPKQTGSAKFSDVADGLWYTPAVIWAEANGIVMGYEDNTFRPDNKISRQELAVMLTRYAKLVGVDTTASGSLSAYPDGSSVAPWAEEAVLWCVAKGIITGDKNGNTITLNPLNDATRAQFAAIIMRFEKLQEN